MNYCRNPSFSRPFTRSDQTKNLHIYSHTIYECVTICTIIYTLSKRILFTSRKTFLQKTADRSTPWRRGDLSAVKMTVHGHHLPIITTGTITLFKVMQALRVMYIYFTFIFLRNKFGSSVAILTHSEVLNNSYHLR